MQHLKSEFTTKKNKMAKKRKIGGISFGSEEAYQKFLSLSKEEQKQQVYNSLNPKDMVLAEKLLTHIDNGDSTGSAEKDTVDKAKRPSGAGKANDTEKPDTASTKG